MTPEWSHKVEADSLSSKVKYCKIKASEDECADLARRFRVSEVRNLKADLQMVKASGSHVFHVYGSFEAEVIQPCVITTDPVVQVINEETEEIVYTLRIKGDRFIPKIFEDGTYTIIVSEPDENKEKVINGLKGIDNQKGKELEIVL